MTLAQLPTWQSVSDWSWVIHNFGVTKEWLDSHMDVYIRCKVIVFFSWQLSSYFFLTLFIILQLNFFSSIFASKVEMDGDNKFVVIYINDFSTMTSQPPSHLIVVRVQNEWYEVILCSHLCIHFFVVCQFLI